MRIVIVELLPYLPNLHKLIHYREKQSKNTTHAILKQAKVFVCNNINLSYPKRLVEAQVANTHIEKKENAP